MFIKSFHWKSTGFCTALEAVAHRGGRWKHIRFPAYIGLLEHAEHGLILFDTGYSQRFFESTQQWPYRMYRYSTPVFLDGFLTARQHVEQLGYSAESVRHVIVSHFHGDHTGGLKDFPNATFYCHEAAARQLRELDGFSAVSNGILPGQTPDDFFGRCRTFSVSEALPDPDFGYRWDLFGDGSIELVDLPGHGCGQTGIRFSTTGQRWFLVADAAWTQHAIDAYKLPLPIVRLFFHDWAAFKKTLWQLHLYQKAHPEVRLVATHEEKIFC